jgi:hypothetical protein
MSSWRCCAIALVSALTGCAGGQTGSEGYEQGIGVLPGVEPPPANAACATDESCHLRLQNLIGSLKLPANGAPRQLVGASCVQTAGCAGSAAASCVCSFNRGGSSAEDHLQLNGGPCALYGRSLSCLLPASELASCTPGTCDCAEQCRSALDLLAADDARAVAVQERVARCENSTCKYVVDIDGRCYVGPLPSTSSPALDCAQSDDALLAAGTAVATTPAPAPNAGTVRQCAAAGSSAPAVADKPLAECTSQQMESSP